MSARSTVNRNVAARLVIAVLALLVAASCSHEPDVGGPVFEQRSQTEVVTDLDACESSAREAAVVLSLKKLDSYTKERLVLEPTLSTLAGKALNYFQSFFMRLWLMITFVVAVPFAVLAFIRLVFIWP
jgi:hypothetical protein